MSEHKHIAQIDGVRAFAVSGVMVSHFLPESNPLNIAAHWGRIGVLCFFVLSGFLITGILLREKDAPARSVLRAFYARRFLRIFPAYYGAIALAFFIFPEFRSQAAWHVFYLGNVMPLEVSSGFSGSGHLWSLAVEEQFYLLWPLLVLLTPISQLRRVLVAMIAASILYKIAAGVSGLSWQMTTRPLWANLDSLGAGALLAVYNREGRVRVPGSAVLWSILFIVTQGYRIRMGGEFRESVGYAAMSDISVIALSSFIVMGSVRGFGGLAARILEASPVRYLGTVSYGVYLFHLFIREIIPDRGFFVLCAASVCVAILSWKLFESPVNDMKSRFPYSRLPSLKHDGHARIERSTA